MNFEHELCILFLYHKCDELTIFHLSCLRRSNPKAAIIPLTDSVPELLPDSVDVGSFPNSFLQAPKWRSIDITLYRWFENKTLKARRYVVIEYDCLCNVDLLEYYSEVLDADVAGVDLFSADQNPRWKWFGIGEEMAKIPAEDRKFAAAIVPFTCTMFSHEALENIVANIYKHDVFCELRLGTIVRKLGLEFKRLPLSKRSTICWHTYPWQANRPGLFHAIKTIDHNQNKGRQPGRLISYVYDFLRSSTHDREFLPFNLNGKMSGLKRRLGSKGNTKG